MRGWRRAGTEQANLAVAHAFPQLVTEFEGHTGPLVDVSFSPNGQFVVTGSADRTARIWDVQTSRLKFTLAAT